MKSVYGPVASWRLGSSLGVDLICSKKKICSFDCIYCQLGKQENITILRKKFISNEKIIKEVSETLKIVNPDIITFSGTGEPTISKNLDLAINEIKKITKIPLAILTNSTLMNNKDVIKSLCKLDVVVAKLDAPNEKLFQEINKPLEDVNFETTFQSIKNFKKVYTGKLNIQTMFMKNNINYAEELANIISEINPFEVQINTPLRPCPIKPLTKEQLNRIEKIFKKRNLNTISVYTSKKPKTSPMDKMEIFMRRSIYK